MKKTALVPAFGMPTAGSAFRADVCADVWADVWAAATGAIPGPPTWSPPS